MGASAAYAKLFLRGIAWDAAEASVSLLAQLKAVSRSQLQDTNQGRVLIGTSGDGVSVNYALPSGGSSFTQSDITELCSLLLDMYEHVTEGAALTDDAALKAMLAIFDASGRRRSRPSFSVNGGGLR